MIKFNPQAGLACISKSSRQVFEYTINALKSIQVTTEKANQAVFGKQADDVTSLMKLQRQLIELSHSSANFVVPFHFMHAVEVLEHLKTIKSPKVVIEVNQTITAWNGLKAIYDSQD